MAASSSSTSGSSSYSSGYACSSSSAAPREDTPPQGFLSPKNVRKSLSSTAHPAQTRAEKRLQEAKFAVLQGEKTILDHCMTEFLRPYTCLKRPDRRECHEKIVTYPLEIQEIIGEVQKQSRFVQKKSLPWGMKLLLACDLSDTFKKDLPQLKPLLTDLANYRDPQRRTDFTKLLLDHLYLEKNTEKRVALINALKGTGRNKRVTAMLLAALLPLGDGEQINKYVKALCLSKDRPWIKTINNALFAISKEPCFDTATKLNLLDIIANIPGTKKIRAERVKKTVSDITFLILSDESAVTLFSSSDDDSDSISSDSSDSSDDLDDPEFLFNEDDPHCLKEVETTDDIQQLVKDSFLSSLDLLDIEHITDKFTRTIGAFRDPSDVFLYLKELRKFNTPEYEKAYLFYIRGVLEGTFKKDRYDIERNIHLNTVFEGRDALRQEWQKGVKKELRYGCSIVDTDDPQDLLVCGEETLSCLEFSSTCSRKRGLLGYLHNGQTRLLAVKDKTGRILGRCMLRLLWDKENKEPVLYREKIYGGHSELLVKMSEERAEAMGLPLAYYESRHLKRRIYSLGGPAPCEYVDGVSHVGAVRGSAYSLHV